MGYVIYDKASTRTVGKAYKTMPAAQAAITRLSKKYWRDHLNTADFSLDNDPKYNLGAAEANYFHENIEKKVKRTNLMSGKEYYESVNTPRYCSPSSEAYWSM